MAGPKIITVFGATGQQGGSVARIFLEDAKLKSDWSVRAVTRDVTKDAAKELQAKGAEVVSANLDDKSSLVKAIKGSSVVFAVTNYWEKLDMKAEIQQGKNLVDAAKEAGVELFIWSSLLNVAKLSNGVLPHVYHFDGKAEVEEYARAAGIPATFYLAGFYMSNLPGNMIRQNPPDNNWTFGLPVPETAPIPLVDISDTGKFIKGIVSHREETLGKRILGASAYLTCREILDEFKKAFPEAGKTAGYFNIPHDTFLQILKGQGMPEFAAVEMLENMRLLQEYGYFGGEKLDASHAILEDKLTTWEEFLKKTPVFQELN